MENKDHLQSEKTAHLPKEEHSPVPTQVIEDKPSPQVDVPTNSKKRPYPFEEGSSAPSKERKITV